MEVARDPAATSPAPAGSGKRHAGLATMILLAPACVLFAAFVIYPILASIRLSLHDWDGIGAMTFVGIDNYRELYHDPTFGKAFANNLRWLACYLAAPLAGLALAVMLQRLADEKPYLKFFD